ncbi:MAG: hypothetical protein NTX11_01940 [Candidatus Saccharibacteria bacterium]|nr:hypothetical protein [Candidatus Saccharibacteria bacterium]
MTQKAFASAPPLLGIASTVTDPTSEATATFNFVSTQDADIYCKVDGAAYQLCGDPFTTNTLTAGSHTFYAYASNVNGDSTIENRTWVIDTTAPDTFISGTYAGDVTVNTSSAFEFTSPENPTTFECSIDSSPYTACTSPYTTADLVPGAHTFRVRAIDAANNIDASPATYTWRVNDIETGDGTPEHPFQVRVCDDLAGINFALAASYELANNIDCSESTVVPIGNSNVPFTGTFHGNGYTISNIDMVNDGNLGTGLFGATDGATISAVRLEDSSFVEGEAIGSNNLGALVGKATSTTISDITSSNLSVSTSDGSANYVGGMVGYMEGTSVLENSHFDGTISNGSNSQNGTGGLVGFSIGTSNVLQSDVRNSYATGIIEGTNYIGGLIGRMDDWSSLRKSYSDITINSNGEGIGGLVGYVGKSSSFISHNFSVSTMNVVLHDGSVGALMGVNHGSASNNYFVTYAPDPSGLPCYGTNSGFIANCTGVSSADYFKGNSSNQPLSSFDEVWNLHEEGQLPSFAIGQVICDDPHTQSESTLEFGCDWSRQIKHHYSGNAASRQIRYRLRNSSDSWKYQDWPLNTMKVVITGLLPATNYEVQFHTKWDIGSSDWTSATAWLSTGSDSNLDTDGDGIKDPIEINGPNFGDANGDHTGDSYTNGDDSKQANVTSLVNSQTGKYVVLQSNCTAQSAVSVVPESTVNADSGYNYNSGLVNFTATGCGPTATFTQYFYGTYDASKFVARKYNSVTKSYTTIPGAVLSNVTINGQPVLKIVYQITDNGPLDEDPTVGTIKDPSGPASVVVGVPNTGIQRTN